MDGLAVATFVAAAIGAGLTALALGVALAFRYRDRVDIRIESIIDENDGLTIVIRNRGGTPTRIADLFFDDGGRLAAEGGYALLAGRTTIRAGRRWDGLRRKRHGGPPPRAIYVQDEDGRKSPPRVLSDAIRARFAEG